MCGEPRSGKLERGKNNYIEKLRYELNYKKINTIEIQLKFY